MSKPFEFFKPEDFEPNGWLSMSPSAVSSRANSLLNSRGRVFTHVNGPGWMDKACDMHRETASHEALLICQRPIEREPECDHRRGWYEMYPDFIDGQWQRMYYRRCPDCGKDLR